jgi:hypothetical protein
MAAGYTAIAAAAFAVDAAAQTPTPTLPSTNTASIVTYESAGLYWQSPGGTAGCEVKFRKNGDTPWTQGLAMWYDARDGQCRGSLVHLSPNTWYQVEFNLPGQAATRGLVFKTWANQVPVAQTIAVNSANGSTFNVAQGGTAAGYVVYEGNGAVLDGQNTAQYNVTINASYVIVRGLNLRGAKQDAIRISPNVTDVIIEDNEISGWGRTRDGTWGADMDSGVRAVCSTATMQRVTIQRNKIHSPRYSANSWSDGHPAGPQAITVSYCGGNHVIRHNEIYSANGNYFNDAMGGEDNFSLTGFPNADSDIYANKISHAWDDGIEAEGANENVRIWGNYIDRTAIGIATTATSVGPAYVFRNVWNRAQMLQKVTSLDLDDRQPFFKSGSDSSLGFGRRYFFHNTMLQATQAGLVNGLGGGFGMGGTGSTQLIENTISMNNIYHLWKPGKTAFYQTGSTSSASNDMFNGTMGDMAIANGINATPTYAAGNGWQSESGGQYQLAAGTPGYDGGKRIANFNDSFSGVAPDVGAHEGGSAPMGFGIAASPGSSVGGSGGTTEPPPPPPPPPSNTVTLNSVVSRKIHGAAGPFDLAIDRSQPIGGSVTVEPRAIGAGHKLVFQFSGAVTNAGTVTVKGADGAAIGTALAIAVGNTVEVTITGLPDARRATIALSGVNATTSGGSVSMGFLVGDVNSSRNVTASDINKVKGKMGAVTGSTFIYDVNATGVVDSVDLNDVKLRSGLSI